MSAPNPDAPSYLAPYPEHRLVIDFTWWSEPPERRYDRCLTNVHAQVQAQCGIPREKRIVSALFAIRPSQPMFAALLQKLPTYTANEHQFAHYSEQVMLACELKSITATLPCGCHVSGLHHAPPLP